MKVELHISYDQATGQINVTGAVDNKLVAYGLLESARDAIYEHHARKAASTKLMPVHGQLPSTNGNAN